MKNKMITAKNWRKEVDNADLEKDVPGCNPGDIEEQRIDRNKVKSLISQVLQAQAKDLAGEEVNEYWAGMTTEKIRIRNQYRQDILKRGKKWK